VQCEFRPDRWRYYALANEMSSHAEAFPDFIPVGPIDVTMIADVSKGSVVIIRPNDLRTVRIGETVINVEAVPFQVLETPMGFVVCEWGRFNRENVAFYDRAGIRQWRIGKSPWDIGRWFERVELGDDEHVVVRLADRIAFNLFVKLSSGMIVGKINAATGELVDRRD